MPGQWDPALGGAAQAEVAKQNYLEGMYYCIGVLPAGGLKKDKVYDGYVMGTRVAYWMGASVCALECVRGRVQRFGGQVRGLHILCRQGWQHQDAL